MYVPLNSVIVISQKFNTKLIWLCNWADIVCQWNVLLFPTITYFVLGQMFILIIFISMKWKYSFQTQDRPKNFEPTRVMECLFECRIGKKYGWTLLHRFCPSCAIFLKRWRVPFSLFKSHFQREKCPKCLIQKQLIQKKKKLLGSWSSKVQFKLASFL